MLVLQQCAARLFAYFTRARDSPPVQSCSVYRGTRFRCTVLPPSAPSPVTATDAANATDVANVANVTDAADTTDAANATDVANAFCSARPVCPTESLDLLALRAIERHYVSAHAAIWSAAAARCRQITAAVSGATGDTLLQLLEAEIDTYSQQNFALGVGCGHYNRAWLAVADGRFHTARTHDLLGCLAVEHVFEPLAAPLTAAVQRAYAQCVGPVCPVLKSAAHLLGLVRSLESLAGDFRTTDRLTQSIVSTVRCRLPDWHRSNTGPIAVRLRRAEETRVSQILAAHFLIPLGRHIVASVVDDLADLAVTEDDVASVVLQPDAFRMLCGVMDRRPGTRAILHDLLRRVVEADGAADLEAAGVDTDLTGRAFAGVVLGLLARYRLLGTMPSGPEVGPNQNNPSNPSSTANASNTTASSTASTANTSSTSSTANTSNTSNTTASTSCSGIAAGIAALMAGPDAAVHMARHVAGILHTRAHDCKPQLETALLACAYLADRATFAALHTDGLAARLQSQRANVGLEQHAIALIQQMAGYATVARMHKMVHECIVASALARQSPAGCRTSIRVFSSGIWPSPPPARAIRVPQELQDGVAQFAERYAQEYPHRRLTWAWSLCTAELTTLHPYARQIICPLAVAVVLLAFPADSDELSQDMLADVTGLGPHDLADALKLLSNAHLLEQRANNWAICPGTPTGAGNAVGQQQQQRVNLCRRRRVLGTISTQTRKMPSLHNLHDEAVQAALVRYMKQAQTADAETVIRHVAGRLAPAYVCTASDIARQIDSLIARDFIRRNEDHMLEYIP